MKFWKVFGEITLTGIMADSKEEAIKIAKIICDDDKIESESFFSAVEEGPNPMRKIWSKESK